MSVKVSGMVWDSALPRDMKFVALANADHANHDGTSVYPGRDTIARMTGYKRRSVVAITKQLVDAGILVPDGVSDLKTNRYRFDFETLARFGEGAKNAPVQKKTRRGAKNCSEVGAKSAPNPSVSKTSVPGTSSGGDLFQVDGDLPPPLNTPEHREAWEQWIESRTKRRKKPTDVALRLQIKRLLEIGPERALAALRHSARNDYTGIHEPSGRDAAAAPPPRPKITKANAL